MRLHAKRAQNVPLLALIGTITQRASTFALAAEQSSLTLTQNLTQALVGRATGRQSQIKMLLKPLIIHLACDALLFLANAAMRILDMSLRMDQNRLACGIA